MPTQEPGFVLRLDKFDELMAHRGCTNLSQQARELGVSHSTLGRIRRGEIRPGARFIAATTRVLHAPVEYLFSTATEAR